MFTQTWKKYLPVIVILMKRSATGDQVLKLNGTDFTRAAGGKKTRLSFSSVKINNGRVNALSETPALAMELITLLKENMTSKNLLGNQQFEFAMNNDFVLSIKNSTPAA